MRSTTYTYWLLARVEVAHFADNVLFSFLPPHLKDASGLGLHVIAKAFWRRLLKSESDLFFRPLFLVVIGDVRVVCAFAARSLKGSGHQHAG